MELLKVDPFDPDPATIAHAARLLRSGGLVAFPTETVYGLGANALDPDAVARIYAAKGRPAWNPVIAHVATVADARALTSAWSDDAERLAEAFWPGPLTLVLPRARIVPDIATAGLDAIAIRIPRHPVALALIRAAGRPIAAPSANRFTQVSPTTAQHVVSSLGDRVDVILDGGSSDVGIESSVCDLSGAEPTLLRPGMITRAQLELVLGRPVLSARRRAQDSAADGAGVGAREGANTTVNADNPNTPAQRSPGMSDRHYAPRADVWLFEASQYRDIVQALEERQRASTSGRITALLLDTTALPLSTDDVIVQMPNDPAAYARQLYGALHAADNASSAVVVIERPPDTEPWLAVLDRLTRAAR